MDILNYILSKEIFIKLLLFNRNKTIILGYHGVYKHISPVENFDGRHVSQKLFIQQMKFIKKYFNIIKLEDFIEYNKNNKIIPKNSIIITFDDGYKNNYTIAYPILKKYQFPAQIFILPELINKKDNIWASKLERYINLTTIKQIRFNKKEFLLLSSTNKINFLNYLKKIIKNLSRKKREKIINYISEKTNINDKTAFYDENHQLLNWEEINIMKSNNISFGSHTMTHEILLNINDKELKYQLSLSYSTLSKQFKTKRISFAYPNGVFRDELIPLLEKINYSCALTTQYGKCSRKSNLFKLNRIIINNDNTMNFFKLNLFFNLNKFYYSISIIKRTYHKVLSIYQYFSNQKDSAL